MINSSPAPTLANVRFEPADHHHLDEVVAIMESAFDDRFGEGWTRSQCAGILPMRGVSMLIARDGGLRTRRGRHKRCDENRENEP